LTWERRRSEGKIAIYGIEGGIGSGKTITGVTLLLKDMFDGKTIYSNVKLKNIPKKYDDKIIYLTKDCIAEIFEKIKRKEWNMENSTIFIQEAHNYMDSRNSASSKNKTLSYWILQSRHTGKGSCDIIYDTQELGQVDIRLRRNTDFIIHPTIIQFMHFAGVKKPSKIRIEIITKIGQDWRKMFAVLDVLKTCDMYNTHELVDF